MNKHNSSWRGYMAIVQTSIMKTKPLTFLLSLTFLFLFNGSVYDDDFQDGFEGKE